MAAYDGELRLNLRMESDADIAEDGGNFLARGHNTLLDRACSVSLVA